MRLHRGDVFAIVAQRQQPAVHGGVERLDPPVHHFGKAGKVGHVAHGKPYVAQCLGSAAGADQFNAARRQCCAQFSQTRLVGH